MTILFAIRRAAVLAALASGLSACAAIERGDPVPLELAEEARPVGLAGEAAVRIWGDRNDPEFVERMILARAETVTRMFADATETPRLSYLALSGGGQYGAFSAGALTAWSARGDRPEFNSVSGISTGAIIAPFAFLGEEYDDLLRSFYTETSTEDLLEPTIFAGLLGGPGLADTAKLRARIDQFITPELLARVAEEHAKGRLLVVGTTNIDLGRPVLWNMGAIAADGGPGALDLFRDVIQASAAIPIAFPPVFIDVEAGGRRYDEMHVDGGATRQVNALSPQIPGFVVERMTGIEIDRDLYVLVNGAIRPPPKLVEPTALSIGGAAIDTLWYAQTVGDLYRILAVAERDGIETHFGWIPESFEDEPVEEFDPVFMRRLFDLGARLLENGALWSPAPPDFATEESVAAYLAARGAAGR